MKKQIILIVSLLTILLLTACSEDSTLLKGNDPDVKNWELVENSGKKSVVTLCVDGVSEAGREWLQTEFADYLKLTYEIDLKLVEQTQAKTFEILANDQRTENQSGQYDLILIEDRGFKKAYESGYLYGPFADKLPNYKTYLNPGDFEVLYDEGLKTNGYEVPIGKQQLTFIFNENYFYEVPETYDALFELAKGFKGQFTYPSPQSTAEGRSFIVGYLSQGLDYDKLYSKAYTEEELYELVKPKLDKLAAVAPVLYQEGKYYPKSIAEMDQLLFDEVLIFSMSLDYDYATAKMKAYEYPEAADTFALAEGTTGPVAHMGILFNSTNKSGAMLVLNAMLSPEMQASKYDTRKWKQLPIYDPNYAPQEAYVDIKKIKMKSTTLKQDEILISRVPEISDYYQDMMISLWTKHVLEVNTTAPAEGQ